MFPNIVTVTAFPTHLCLNWHCNWLPSASISGFKILMINCIDKNKKVNINFNSKRNLLVITINCQKPQNLTVNRQNLTVNRQTYTPIETSNICKACRKGTFFADERYIVSCPSFKKFFWGRQERARHSSLLSRVYAGCKFHAHSQVDEIPPTYLSI